MGSATRDHVGVRGPERTQERIARRLYEAEQWLASAYGTDPRCDWYDLSAQERALRVHAVGNVLAERLIRLPE